MAGTNSSKRRLTNDGELYFLVNPTMARDGGTTDPHDDASCSLELLNSLKKLTPACTATMTPLLSLVGLSSDLMSMLALVHGKRHLRLYKTA